MELAEQPDGLAAVAPRLGGTLAHDMGAQGADIRGGAMARRVAHDLGLDQAARRIGVLDVVAGRAGDERATIRQQVDDAGKAELAQRLAHQGAADPEDATQLVLAELGARRQSAVADRARDRLGDRIAVRRRPQATLRPLRPVTRWGPA